VSWDFSWERTAKSAVYSGVGMFSYDSSADNRVTHGGSWLGDMDDELTAFNFEGFVDNVSIGAINSLPDYFDFSSDHEIIWALSANNFFFSEGAGVGCLVNLCALSDDGNMLGGSIGALTVTRHGAAITGGTGPTGLAEPGLFGLTMAGMLLGAWRRRRHGVG